MRLTYLQRACCVCICVAMRRSFPVASRVAYAMHRERSGRNQAGAGKTLLMYAVCSGHGRQDGGHSSSNLAEAQAVGRLVRQLAAAGVDASAIGVICFFTAQVFAGYCHNFQEASLFPAFSHMFARETAVFAQSCTGGECVVQVKAVQHQLGFAMAAGGNADLQARRESGTAGGCLPQVATVDSFQARYYSIYALPALFESACGCIASCPVMYCTGCPWTVQESCNASGLVQADVPVGPPHPELCLSGRGKRRTSSS